LAESYGADTCPGIYMMIYQGIEAFKLWTGKEVSESTVEKVHAILKRRLESAYGK